MTRPLLSTMWQHIAAYFYACVSILLIKDKNINRRNKIISVSKILYYWSIFEELFSWECSILSIFKKKWMYFWIMLQHFNCRLCLYVVCIYILRCISLNLITWFLLRFKYAIRWMALFHWLGKSCDKTNETEYIIIL